MYSGSDVPGEGEHKIVDYIRQSKVSSDFDSDATHCIYGLDADLIMLGLVTHLPNVFILREETVSQKKKKNAAGYRDSIKITDNFELIHISLLREYLELEFSEVKDKIKFEYNCERIIDDFLFICFFIGNDFLPSLNTLDIEEGSLDKIIEIYKNVLPQLDDYISFHGKIDYKKAEFFFKGLAKLELESLQSMLKKLEFKCKEREERREKLTIEKSVAEKKKKIALKKLKKYKEIKSTKKDAEIKEFKLALVQKRIKKLKDDYAREVQRMGVTGKTFEEDVKKYNNGEPLFSDIGLSVGGLPTNITTIKSEIGISDSKRDLANLFDSDDEDQDKKQKKKKQINAHDAEQCKQNVFHILKCSTRFYKYLQQPNYVSDFNPNDMNDSDVSSISDVEITPDDKDFKDGFDNKLIECQDFEKIFQQKLISLYISDVGEAKKFYYSEKVKIKVGNAEGQAERRTMFQKYLEGLQWVLFYYYRGVQSWKWYYPYHYPPMISDFENIESILDYDLEDKFSKLQVDPEDRPLLPFQSLLMILPETSKNLLPQAYHSVYIDYPEIYPKTFIVDFNGKRLPWEALVILPFVDDIKLREYEIKVRSKYSFENEANLLAEEKPLMISEQTLRRNVLGKTWIYEFLPEERYIPNLKKFKMFDLTGKYLQIKRNEISLDSSKIKIDLAMNYSTKIPSFKSPTLSDMKFQYFFNKIPAYTSKRKGSIGDRGGSRPPIKKNKVLTIHFNSRFEKLSEEESKKIIHNALLNKDLFVNLPYKSSAKLVGVAFYDKYYFLSSTNTLESEPYKISNEMKNMSKAFLNRTGIYLETLNSHIFLEIVPFDRYIRSQNGDLIKVYQESERYFTPVEVSSLNSASDIYNKLSCYYKSKYEAYTSVESEFNKGTKAILLTNTNYGSLGQIDSLLNEKDPEYMKNNELNYDPKYYDLSKNYDLSEYDWKIEISKLYNKELVKIETMPNNLNEMNRHYQPGLNNTTVYNPYDFNNDFIPNSSVFPILKKTEEFYVSMDDLAKQIGISVWTLSIISSCVYVVNPSNDEYDEDIPITDLEHWNLGLNLKSNRGAKLVLPGYTRYFAGEKNSYNWEFSTVAVNLIQEYYNRFYFVFEALQNFDQTLITRYIRIGDLFTSKLSSKNEIIEPFNKSRLDEVARWISSLSLNCLGFASHNSNFISVKDVKRIDEFVQQKVLLNSNTHARQASKFVLNPNYLILDTVPYVERFGYIQKFNLGDRVINTRSDDSRFVPFGLKGIVTGVCDNFLEILFDFPFFGGETCGGRLPEGRGMYIEPQNLLNLTNKAPVFLRRNKENFNHTNYKDESQNYSYEYFDYPPTKESSYTHQSYSLDPNLRSYNSNIHTPTSGITASKFSQTKKIILKSDTTSVEPSKTVPPRNKKDHQDKEAIQSQLEPTLIETVKPKKIILKENPEFSQGKNHTNYNKNRLFQSEQLKKNQLYYFGSSQNKERLQLFNNNIV